MAFGRIMALFFCSIICFLFQCSLSAHTYWHVECTYHDLFRAYKQNPTACKEFLRLGAKLIMDDPEDVYKLDEITTDESTNNYIAIKDVGNDIMEIQYKLTDKRMGATFEGSTRFSPEQAKDRPLSTRHASLKTTVAAEVCLGPNFVRIVREEQPVNDEPARLDAALKVDTNVTNLTKTRPSMDKVVFNTKLVHQAFLLKETVDTVFENDVSRYEIWRPLGGPDEKCISNITKCIVIARLISGCIVQNYNERTKQIELHHVLDEEFKCNVVIRQKPKRCSMRRSQFGIYRDFGAIHGQLETLYLACGYVLHLDRYFYNGGCEISLEKGKKTIITMKNTDQHASRICFSVIIDGKEIRSGTIEKHGSTSVPYQLSYKKTKVKVYCGHDVYERSVELNSFAHCVMRLESVIGETKINEHFCQYINMYKVIITGVVVSILFLLILKCGLSFVFIPVYILVTLMLSMLQVCLKRKKRCGRCASVLYWGDPHLTCRYACGYCGQFSSHRYEDLKQHKENCENIHLKISPIIIFRTMLRSKFIINCINLATAALLIWMLSNLFHVDAVELTESYNTSLILMMQLKQCHKVKEWCNNSLSHDRYFYLASVVLYTFLLFAVIFALCLKINRLKLQLHFSHNAWEDTTRMNDLLSQELINHRDDLPVYVPTVLNPGRRSASLNNLLTTLAIISFLCNPVVSNVLPAFGHMNFPNLNNVREIHGGNYFILPNLTSAVITNNRGGVYDTNQGAYRAIQSLTKALDGEYDDYEEPEPSTVDLAIDKAKGLLNQIDTKVRDGTANIRRMEAIEKTADQYLQKVRQENHAIAEKNEARLTDIDKQMASLHGQLVSLANKLDKKPEDEELRRLYEQLSERFKAIATDKGSRHPRRRPKRSKHIEFTPHDDNHETVTANAIEPAKALEHHKRFVESRHHTRAKSIPTENAEYSSRVLNGAERKCLSQTVFIDTVEKDNNAGTSSIKVMSQFDLRPETCAIFEINLNNKLYDTVPLVVKVTQTRLEWPLTYIYSTYKTDDISIVSEEWCVSGSQYCRQSIMKNNEAFLKSGGIVISWDHCQNWGCDFPGCGTAFSGSCCIICRDTYHYDTEVRIYQLGRPRYVFELCYQYPGNSQCKEISSSMGKPTQSFAFSSSLTDLDSEIKNQVYIAVDHKGNVRTGQICGISAYCDDFGSMQVIDGIVHGTDAHSADFKCHGIGWKTYEVRACFKNTWNLFSLLKQLEPAHFKIIESDKGPILIEKDLYLGKVSWSAELTGVHLQEKESKVELSAELVTCTGCWACAEHALCHIRIDSNINFAAQITCKKAFAISNTIGVKFGENDYSVAINFLQNNFQPECAVTCMGKKYPIKQNNPFILEKGNITWLDLETVAYHKEPNEATTLFWDWSLLNPFAKYTWTGLRIGMNIVIYAICLAAGIVFILVAIKYCKLLSRFIRTIIDDLKTGNESKSLTDEYIHILQEEKRKNKILQSRINSSKGIHKFE